MHPCEIWELMLTLVPILPDSYLQFTTTRPCRLATS